MLGLPLLGFHQRLFSKKTVFGIFATSILLFAIADGMFSYQVPLWLESITHDVALVGLVMGSSSLVGFFCDAFFPKFFAGKTYRFFAVATFFVAALTQVIGLTLSNWFGALAVMALWGVYYELFLFGLYHFLHTEIEPAQHAGGWGITEALRSLGLIASPLLASVLFVVDASPFVYSTLLFLVAGILNVTLFRWVKRRVPKDIGKTKDTFSVATFRVWSIFLKKIWPVYLFFVCVILLDASIWTAGVFFAEDLRRQSSIGAFFVPAYYLPVLLAPLFAGKLARRFGKKRTAFFASIPLSLILFLGHWTQRSPLWHVLVMLVAGSCTALIVTESEAIFEDYVARLHRFSSEMVGLVRSASNVGYILGPLIAGFAAEWLGSHRTVALVGLLPGIMGIVALIMMRGKTQLPQQQLESLG